LLKEIKEVLYKNGAEYASLSGSGSALYAISDQKIEINPFQDFMSAACT